MKLIFDNANYPQCIEKDKVQKKCQKFKCMPKENKSKKHFTTTNIPYACELEQFKSSRWKPLPLPMTKNIEIKDIEKIVEQNKKTENNLISKKIRTANIKYYTTKTYFENELSLPLFKDDSLRGKILFIWETSTRYLETEKHQTTYLSSLSSKTENK